MRDSAMIPLKEAVLRYRPSRLLKWFGYKSHPLSDRYDFHWGILTTGWHYPRFELVQFSESSEYDKLWALAFSFGWGLFWLELPDCLPKQSFGTPMEANDVRHWGYHTTAECVVFSWKDTYRCYALPWRWRLFKHEILCWNGQWRIVPKESDHAIAKMAFSAHCATECHPYYYITRDGHIQNCTASFYVEQREYRRHYFFKWSWNNLVHRSINVTFSRQLGEKAYTAQGGVTNWVCHLLHDETPHEAMIRMRETVKFT